MKKNLLLLSALFIALFAGVSEIAAQTSKNKSVDTGIFYKITGKNLKKPSYLLGTFHLICQKDLFPAETIKSYVSQTEKLMLEIDLSDPAVMQKATSGAMLTDGKTAKDFLKTEDYAKIDALFKNYLGISYDQLQTFKPFMASTVLMMSPKIVGCQAAPGYDKILADAAAGNKTPIVGLENVEDEFAAIDAQPLDKQFADLVKVAADPEKTIADFKNLYRVYLSQNYADLYKTLETQMKDSQESKAKLLDERNAKWIPVIEKNIAQSPVFIAVGGGHLGGEKGVINLLRKKGYTLTPIKL
jgi:uncharacterized protein